jgi:hypothetical protein
VTGNYTHPEQTPEAAALLDEAQQRFARHHDFQIELHAAVRRMWA